MNSHIVRLDMLIMQSVASDRHFKHLDVLMSRWRATLDDMCNENMFIFLWYSLTFRYNKTAWYQVNLARKAYEEADRAFNKPLLNTGLYW